MYHLRYLILNINNINNTEEQCGLEKHNSAQIPTKQGEHKLLS